MSGRQPQDVVPIWRPDGDVGRLVRSGAFVAISLGLAAGAHRAAGGAVPGWPVLLPAAAVLATLGWYFSRRECTATRIYSLTIGTQVLLHAAFMTPMLLAFDARSGRPSDSTLAKLLFCQHGHDSISHAQVQAAAGHLDLGGGAASEMPEGMASMHVGLSTALMFAGHLAAAVVVAWWLRQGERAAWRLVGRLAASLRPVRLPPPSRVRAVCSFYVERAVGGHDPWATPPGRGPPHSTPALYA